MSWSPHVVVASIVERDSRFLLVEERIEGALVLNQPAGHWEKGETLIEAARREALEESAWEVEPTALLGIYHYQPVDLEYSFLRVAFISEAGRHHPQRKLDTGIERAVWLTRKEIAEQHERHRSPMVLRCVDDYLAGRHYPLTLLTHF